jgi:hypothetical protein
MVTPHRSKRLVVAELNDFGQRLRWDTRKHFSNTFDREAVKEGIEDAKEGHAMTGDANASTGDSFQASREHEVRQLGIHRDALARTVTRQVVSLGPRHGKREADGIGDKQGYGS